MGILHKALLPFLSLSLLLQAADPPAEVDIALRSRVTEFYQLLVAKKGRLAEELVASDTKDFYYNMAKPNILAFSIKTIQYAPDLKSAHVTLSATMIMMMGGAPPKGFDVPYGSDWKLDEGKWCMYVDQAKLLETPFGKVHVDSTTSSDDVSKVIGRFSSAAIANGVHADPMHVPFDPANPKPQVVMLKNTLPGPVTIEPINPSEALKVEIAKPNLGADESTQVTITPVAGSADHPTEVTFRIGPLSQIIKIALDYP
jgi:hypothetical protein